MRSFLKYAPWTAQPEDEDVGIGLLGRVGVGDEIARENSHDLNASR